MRKMELKMETKNEVESMKAEKAYQCKKEKISEKKEKQGIKIPESQKKGALFL
jgi:hypothetical protein